MEKDSTTINAFNTRVNFSGEAMDILKEANVYGDHAFVKSGQIQMKYVSSYEDLVSKKIVAVFDFGLVTLDKDDSKMKQFLQDSKNSVDKMKSEV